MYLQQLADRSSRRLAFAENNRPLHASAADNRPTCDCAYDRALTNARAWPQHEAGDIKLRRRKVFAHTYTGAARVKSVSNRRARQEACFLAFTSQEAIDQLGVRGQVTQAVPVPTAYKVQPNLIRYHGEDGDEDADITDLTHLLVEV